MAQFLKFIYDYFNTTLVLSYAQGDPESDKKCKGGKINKNSIVVKSVNNLLVLLLI